MITISCVFLSRFRARPLSLSVKRTNTYPPTHTHTNMHTHIHIYTHTYTRARARTRTHTGVTAESRTHACTHAAQSTAPSSAWCSISDTRSTPAACRQQQQPRRPPLPAPPAQPPSPQPPSPTFRRALSALIRRTRQRAWPHAMCRGVSGDAGTQIIITRVQTRRYITAGSFTNVRRGARASTAPSRAGLTSPLTAAHTSAISRSLTPTAPRSAACQL